MIYTVYCCKECGRQSCEMELTNHKHDPTIAQKNKFPRIAHEILECPCGMLNRWHTMEELRLDRS